MCAIANEGTYPPFIKRFLVKGCPTLSRLGGVGHILLVGLRPFLKRIMKENIEMAQFTNQAQLTYSNGVVNSNIAVGELLEVLSAAKNAVRSTYTGGDRVTYVVSAVNAGPTAITGITVTDDLGTYDFGTAGDTRTPLTYVDGSVRLYINGTLSTTPTVTAADGSVTFGGITIPAGGNMVLVYEALVNDFAPLGTADSIVNTATVTGAGISTPVIGTATVTPEARPNLTITKSVEPVPVTENGTLTYRFIIQNYGNAEAGAADNVVLTDTFDPILSNLSVSYNGATWTEGTEYTYNEATGLLTTTQGAITVPAATYTQDPTTGAWVVTPGVSTLTVTGTV